jgi:CheY-like chemotaxis protein
MTPLRPSLTLDAPEPTPILYLDDDPRDLQLLRDSFARSVSNPVIYFTTAAELYAYLDIALGPFIILVDLVLLDHPGFGGGYEVISLLHAREDLQEPRSAIVAITGTPIDDLIRERVRVVGADGCFNKPLTAADLAVVLGQPGWFPHTTFAFSLPKKEGDA